MPPPEAEAPAKLWLCAVAYGRAPGYPEDAAQIVQERIDSLGRVPGLEVRRRDAGDGIEAWVDPSATHEHRTQVESAMWGFALGFRLGRGDPT